MIKPHSNQATPKYLGYVYQVLIAIEQCFQAKKNETIWIECFGDVYNGDTCTEVKHHFKPTNLIDNSVDFWKTLKNLVSEDTRSFNSLILHTTGNIPEKSIFYGWNELTKTAKYNRLKNHSPNDTVKPFYDESITNYPRKDLLPILERFIIKSSQLNIKDKWQELRDTRLFSLIPEKHKDDAFHWVYGYVHKRAIDNRNNWHIKINDFDVAFEHGLSKYRQGKIPFEILDKKDINCNTKNFKFVEKMEEITLRRKIIEGAISEYLRAEQNKINLLKYEPFTMTEILDSYDSSILEGMESLKYEYSEKIEKQDLDTEVSLETAKKMYFNSLKIELINIQNVDDTQRYYQNGRIHHNVNEGHFMWKFCEDDLL